jgi:hypothetical protein
MDDLFSRFAPVVAASSLSAIKADPSLGGRLVIAREGALSMIYSPFDYVNPTAKVVLVGITPGRQQAVNALTEARRQLLMGRDHNIASKAAKETASFSGSMRSSLVAMLDHVGLAEKLGLSSCAQLFGDRADLVHYTSALRYPVFVGDSNYTGQPAMTVHPLLRQEVATNLAAEVKLVPDAVWIPLGPAPASALNWLAAQGLFERGRILEGLPHPSGANAERITYFLGRKPAAALSSKTNAASIDAARSRCQTIVSQMRVWTREHGNVR